MNHVTAYPLCWPDGWARTDPDMRQWQLSSGSSFQPGWNAVLNRLQDNLRLLDADNVILSTDQPLRKSDGQPYATRRHIEDPGAAVYFTLDGKSLVMARDAYVQLNDNIRSLCLAIEGLRKMHRHGGATMLERAFRGFEALPNPDAEQEWWEILGFNAVPEGFGAVRDAYQRLAFKVHPERGGTTEEMSRVNVAYHRAKKHYRVSA